MFFFDNLPIYKLLTIVRRVLLNLSLEYLFLLASTLDEKLLYSSRVKVKAELVKILVTCGYSFVIVANVSERAIALPVFLNSNAIFCCHLPDI